MDYRSLVTISKVLLTEKNDRHLDAALEALEMIDNCPELYAQYATLACEMGYIQPKFFKKYPRFQRCRKRWSKMVTITRSNGRYIYFYKLTTIEDYEKYGGIVFGYSRYFDIPSSSVTKKLKTDALGVDDYSFMDLLPSDLSIVLDRCKFIQNHDMQLWRNRFLENYSPYFRAVIKVMEVYQYPTELIKRLTQIMGTPEDECVKLFSPYHSIRSTSNRNKLDILGMGDYRKYECYYEEEIVEDEVMDSILNDVPGFIQRMRELAKDEIDIIVRNAQKLYPGAKLSNVENLIGESIYDYHSCDRLSVCDNRGLIFTFTRDEYKHLIVVSEHGEVKPKLNPYTNKPLPQSFADRAEVVGWHTYVDEVFTVAGYFDHYEKPSIDDRKLYPRGGDDLFHELIPMTKYEYLSTKDLHVNTVNKRLEKITVQVQNVLF